MGNFNRVSEIMKLYPNVNWARPSCVAIVYALKQFDAVLWGLSSGIEKKVESVKDRLRDISVYMKLVQILEGRGV